MPSSPSSTSPPHVVLLPTQMNIQSRPCGDRMSVLVVGFAFHRWQKVLCHGHAFTRHDQGDALRGIDNLIAIAQEAADQRNMVMVLPCAGDYLCRTAIVVHNVIASQRSTYPTAVFRFHP